MMGQKPAVVITRLNGDRFTGIVLADITFGTV
jgi:hypothetical protein